MSDNADRPVPESGGTGADDTLNVEDVDSLLASVEALTSKVEAEVGLRDDQEDPVAIAAQIKTDVAAIEQSVADSVAEAADVLKDELADGAPPAVDEGAAPAGADLVTAEDVAVADAEIFADEQPASESAESLQVPTQPLAEATVSGGDSVGALKRLAGITVGWLDRILEMIDHPFAEWTSERKALVGYVAIATLAMALVAWVLGVTVQ